VPGMNSGLNPADPTLVAAFRSALLHQGAIAIIILAFVWLLWATARTWRLTTPAAKPEEGAGPGTAEPGTAEPGTGGPSTDGAVGPDGTGHRTAGRERWAWLGGGAWEAPGRRLLRIGFGLIWILDGILQAQPKMAGGLAAQVIEPAAAASPAWVQHVVNWGGTIWSYHPIQSGAASVWIQIGLGIWLLVAAHGPWSRLAGLAAVAWGLVVWAFGESFGGIFAPGLSWLTGAPGAVLLYVVAGALVALPEDAWRSPRQTRLTLSRLTLSRLTLTRLALSRLTLGRVLLAGLGLFYLGMAVLQAWPGRGYWQGVSHGQPGTLAGMVQGMAGTPQPHFLSALVGDFASFAASNGFAVNLVVVIVLAGTGVIFLTGRSRLVRYAVWFGVVFGLADWVLIQDLGFLGGLGTDPNSMIPLILLFGAGYLALAPAPQEAPREARAAAGAHVTGEDEPDEVTVGGGGTGNGGGSPDRGWGRRLRTLTPRALSGTVAAASARSVGAVATASARSVGAVAALAIIVLGAAPMAAAAANRTADPILALAIEGGSTQMDLPAPGFTLTDQNGQPVSLASLHGKVVLMTFLDPVCTTDCPIIGAEFKQAGVLLGAQDKDVELVAIVANPTYRGVAFTQAFDREEGLNRVPNWLYLTGSLTALGQVWKQYGVTVADLPAGAMSAHNDLAVVIDRSGDIREEVGADPGPGTTSTQSSFSVLLTQYAQQALAGS
jgi:cytochrome oxidase Cu insertion factor (SCO1/SenC/PrrC family)